MINTRAQAILNCNAKRRFISEGEAQFAIADRTNDQTVKKPPPLRPYACGVCRGWHMTSSVDWT